MISVCMATYNGEGYIFKQIESILHQLKDNDEIIISDNSSDDQTIEIINSFRDKRIKIYTLARDRVLLDSYKGVEKTITKNFENALLKARGEYIFLSDQDDIWECNKISESIKYLKKYDLVMSNAALIDSNGLIFEERLYKKSPIDKSVISFRHRGCLMAFNRHILLKSLPFPRHIMYHDYWIGIIAESVGLTFFIDLPLISHRRGIGNASTDVTQKSRNTLYFKIKYRTVYLMLGVIRVLSRKINDIYHNV